MNDKKTINTYNIKDFEGFVPSQNSRMRESQRFFLSDHFDHIKICNLLISIAIFQYLLKFPEKNPFEALPPPSPPPPLQLIC